MLISSHSIPLTYQFTAEFLVPNSISKPSFAESRKRLLFDLALSKDLLSNTESRKSLHFWSFRSRAASITTPSAIVPRFSAAHTIPATVSATKPGIISFKAGIAPYLAIKSNISESVQISRLNTRKSSLLRKRPRNVWNFFLIGKYPKSALVKSVFSRQDWSRVDTPCQKIEDFSARGSGVHSMSSSSGTPESWISSFCSLLGHEYFAEISEDFIEDDFNLTGLQTQVAMYKEALEVSLSIFRVMSVRANLCLDDSRCRTRRR